MINFIKHSGQPLTYQLTTIQEDLNATYQLSSTSFSTNVLLNSVEITLHLSTISNTPSTFNHSFFQILDDLDGEKEIKIQISTVDNNGQIITHQETLTHIERPILKN